jgi:(S)-ureidoglycine aminohydrolase
MLHQLGSTRSSLKPDHLLQTADTFIRTPLPGATGVDFIVHVGPRMGAGFTQMTAEFAQGGTLAPAAPDVQRFLYVLAGEVELEVPGEGEYVLRDSDYAYLPPGASHYLRAATKARVSLIEKRFVALPAGDETYPARALVGREAELPAEPLGGDPALLVRRMMPDGPAWDFAVNTMTYAPGATLSQVEIHVMEHGLLMLEGGGIYRLGDNWYPVTAGDFIWMAPYCPQWFGALGKTPAKYLIYKDWYRHPLGV